MKRGLILGFITSLLFSFILVPQAEANSAQTWVADFVGADAAGFGDGTGSGASFSSVRGLVFDSSGNMIIADTNNHRIRKITPYGVVTTIAGKDLPGGWPPSIADGTGSDAQFSYPTQIAIDSQGNYIVADEWNGVLRKVTPAGVVTTLSNTSVGTRLKAVTVDSQDNIYYGSWSGVVYKRTSAGVVSTLASGFSNLHEITVDRNDNVIVLNTNSSRIYRVTPEGVSTLIAGTGVAGNVDGPAATAQFSAPIGVAVDRDNNLYIADYNNQLIRKLSADGIVSTVAGLSGTGGKANGDVRFTATFHNPTPLAFDAVGNLYTAQDSSTNKIRKITFAPIISHISASTGPAAGETLTITGTGFISNTKVYFNTIEAGNIMPNSTGTTLTVTVPTLSEGAYDVTVVNYETGQHTVWHKFYTVDKTAPAFTVSAQQYSNDGTVVVNGTYADSGVGLDKVQVRGIGTRPVTAGHGTVNWEVIYANVPDGIYQLSATATDRVSNGREAVAGNNTIVDRDAPALTLTVPEKTAQTGVSVNGTVSDGLAGLERLTINNVVTTVTNGTFSIDFPLNPGVNTVTAVAIDKAGNQTTKTASVSRNEFTPAIADGTTTVPLSESLSGQPISQAQILTSLKAGNGTRKTDKIVISAFQSVLKRFGHFSGQVTGFFGATTSRAVESFRRASGLKVSRTVDARVLLKLDEYKVSDPMYIAAIAQNHPGFSAEELQAAVSYQLTKDLKYNRFDEEVKFIQKKLYLLGYYTGSIHGWLNNTTRQAVKDYRADHGLSDGGLVDQILRAKLNNL